MNLVIHKFQYILAICALAFNAGAVEPLKVAASRVGDTQGIDIVVSGVLGYTSDCAFALYPDRISSLMRKGDKAVVMLVDEKGAAISKGVTLDAYINSYVLAKGVLSKKIDSDASLIFEASLVYHAFGKPYEYVAKSECGPFLGDQVLSIEALLQGRKAALGANAEVTVYGILGRDDGVYQLYGSKETAEDGVWVDAIDVIFDSSQALCIGREYLLRGVPKAPRRRSGAQIVLRDAKVTASTCSEVAQETKAQLD